MIKFASRDPMVTRPGDVFAGVLESDSRVVGKDNEANENVDVDA